MNVETATEIAAFVFFLINLSIAVSVIVGAVIGRPIDIDDALASLHHLPIAGKFTPMLNQARTRGWTTRTELRFIELEQRGYGFLLGRFEKYGYKSEEQP